MDANDNNANSGQKPQNMGLKKEGTHFINTEGKFDANKLLQADPKQLAKFINKKTDDIDDVSEDGTPGFSNAATTTINVLAAIAQADQRQHLAPAHSKEVINALAQVAANTLDLSAGLGMTPGRSSFPDHQYPGEINPNFAKKGPDSKGKK